MRARFIPDPAEDRVCTVYGQDFPKGEWGEVGGLAASKLRGNPAFEVEGEDATSELDALRAELDGFGIKYHHKAGVEKLRELLPVPVAEPEPDASV